MDAYIGGEYLQIVTQPPIEKKIMVEWHLRLLKKKRIVGSVYTVYCPNYPKFRREGDR